MKDRGEHESYSGNIIHNFVFDMRVRLANGLVRIAARIYPDSNGDSGERDHSTDVHPKPNYEYFISTLAKKSGQLEIAVKAMDRSIEIIDDRKLIFKQQGVFDEVEFAQAYLISALNRIQNYNAEEDEVEF